MTEGRVGAKCCPICGNNFDKFCIEEYCAWFDENEKKCAIAQLHKMSETLIKIMRKEVR